MVCENLEKVLEKSWNFYDMIMKEPVYKKDLELLFFGISFSIKMLTKTIDFVITEETVSTRFLPLISTLMYQVTEFTLTLDQSGEGEDEGLGGHANVVSDMLAKVTGMVSTLTKTKKEQAERVSVSHFVKFCCVTELLTSSVKLRMFWNWRLIV